MDQQVPVSPTDAPISTPPSRPPAAAQIVKGQKFISRRLIEAATGTGSSSAGYYVYECKTCGKTFPSFQALGGHRASHKKPKAMASAAEMMMMIRRHHHHRSNFITPSDDEDSPRSNNNISTSLFLQLNRGSFFGSSDHGRGHQYDHPPSRVHECGICGAGFSTGQALGGHMRRHRDLIGGGGSRATNTVLSFTPLMGIEPGNSYYDDRDQKRRMTAAASNALSLDLDLNLPAPEQDQDDRHHHLQPEFHFASKKPQEPEQQQQPLVFSPPALVECHY